MPKDQLQIQREEQSLQFVSDQELFAHRDKMRQMNQSEQIARHKYVKNSPLIDRMSKAGAPQVAQPAPPVQGQLGYFDRKKQQSLEKMERKVEEKEAQADAFSDISGVDAMPNDPFAQIERDGQIDLELQKLREELGEG